MYRHQKRLPSRAPLLNWPTKPCHLSTFAFDVHGPFYFENMKMSPYHYEYGNFQYMMKALAIIIF